MRLKRILVTGATGFLGTQIVAGLVEDGYETAAITRPGSDVSGLMTSCIRLQHDGSSEQLFDLVRSFSPDAVVHAATLFVAAHQPPQIVPLITANVAFGAQLVDAMARAGVKRLINFGTSWQHFEVDYYRPVSFYAATKEAFESIASYYIDAHALSMITLKLSDTYGPNDKRQKLIALLLQTARTGQMLEMSPGAQIINLVHVADVVDAVRIALARIAETTPGTESFAVRGEEQMSLRDFVTLFESVSGMFVNVAWGRRPYRDREVMTPWAGPLLPGWRARIPLDRGLRAVIADR